MAARAKKASAVNDQTEADRVLNPVGLRISVAGSSFMVRRKTSDAPATMPGLAAGRVTEVNAPNGERPRLRAASSTLGLICNRVERTAPSAGERNSAT